MSANGTQESGLVAIIGLGCVLPDANSPAEFWENLKAGKGSVREVPKDRWDPDLYYSPDRTAPDKTYSKIGGWVTGFKFDARQFRIPPNVVKSLDDSQLWALHAAAQALADAGYDKKPFDRTRTAVILGNAMGGEVRMMTGMRIMFPEFRRALEEAPGFQALPPDARQRVLKDAEIGFKRAMPEITEDTMPGELSNVIAGRVANLLNLTGKNFTTDAACASSLAAIDAAVRALAHKECDMVLTGGVDKSMDIGSYVKFCKIGALSAHGSFPFDARADGFVMGEGAGMLLLKRFEDAVRDGDRIYGLVRGVGSSSDGKGKGITAPNIDGQISCIQRALLDAQLTPGEVDLIECHGTSTKVGDVVEIQALTQIFGGYVAKKQSVPIGSVKSNLGHLKSAAGAASLIKTVLALHHKLIVPSINFETPNPNIKLQETPFYVATQAAPWPEPATDRPRRAAISSFGFGGTNFHVVLEEYAAGKNTSKVVATPVGEAAAKPAANKAPITSVLMQTTPKTRPAEPPVATARTDVLVVGAQTATELEQELGRVQQRLKTVTQRGLQAFCHDTSVAALGKNVRVACVVESPTDALDKLSKAKDAVLDQKRRGLLANQGIHVGEGKLHGKLAFLFPGQGSQYADMARDLATRFTAVKRTLDDADRVMEPLVGKPLTSFLFSDESHTKDKVEEQLKRTEITQPAVLAGDTALFRLLNDYGVKPDLVAGHSLGEYGALTAAGVLTFEDALFAVSARGREMANVHVPDLGKMASVSADTATVEAKLKNVPGYVIAANKNCKIQTVIAGSSPAVDAAVQMFQKEGIAAQFIPVSAAFHSSIVAPAAEPIRAVVSRLDVREPKIPVLSNVHADYYPRGPGAKQAALDLLGRQVAAPVEWQKQIERMHGEGARVFIEVGPKAVLTTFVKNILEDKPHAALATNHPKKGGFFHFFDTIAFLAANGYPVRLPRSDDANVLLPSFRETLEAPAASASPPAHAPTPVVQTPTPQPVPATTAHATSVTALAFPDLEQRADAFIREKQAELRRVLEQDLRTLAPATAPSNVQTPVADGELLALKKRVDALGLNLEPVLITGVSVGTPGTFKKLFDDSNLDRIFRGENAIEPLTPDERRRQVEKNVVRLVKSATGDHRFDPIRDVGEVIKLAGKKGHFDLEKDYGVGADFADALDITSKIALAAGIEALRDAQIPLVRGYVKTTTGKFLPGEWALPEPLQHETGVIFASVWPGVPKIVEYVSQHVANEYMRKSADERRALYAELVAQVRDPTLRRELEAWCQRHEADLQADGPTFHEFNRRFLFHVLGMGHSQLAQFIRAKGPNTAVQAACSTTTQAVGIAEDWIRMGRCRRVLIVGADDITGPEMLEYWAAGFLAAGAATTEGDVTKAALPFDKRRHGMIIGMGAVGLVVEAESVVRQRGMEGIAEVIASSFLNSAYHGSRLDTEHVAKVMDDLMATVERRTGTPRGVIAKSMLFMSHETYTPARGGSAAAEIEALTKTFGPDVSKVLVANTKGFTGHPMAVGIEDAIAIRCLQTGRVPPIANLREPDPSLGNIQLSRGGHHDCEYGLRLGAGFGSQIAMYVVKLRTKHATRIMEPATYQAWLSRVTGTKNAELEVVNRTLRVKAQLPSLVVDTPPATTAPPVAIAPRPAPVVTPPKPVPTPMPAALSHATVLAKIQDVVAEKTGYPREMLEPELDLEADLGIDTVKQAELFGLLREHYGVQRDDTVQLKDYNTLSKIAQFILDRAAASPVTLERTAVPPTADATLWQPIRQSTDAVDFKQYSTQAEPAPTPVARAKDSSDILARLTAIVADKTGYPLELLESDLDLEADLGIDTVKQAEIFGIVRTEFNVERDDTVQLKDVNTLRKIADYFAARLSKPGTPVAAPEAVVAPTIQPAPVATVAPSQGRLEKTTVLAQVRQLVADKTGYPIDLLEPDLDLEADLGIDTVKQAELFGICRDTFQIPRRDDIQLKDYNTLNKLAEFLVTSSAPPTAATVAAPAPEPPAPQQAPPTAANGSTMTPAPQQAADGGILKRIQTVVADKTGYPLDLLDPELDLEADLGIDTVKQAELFGILRESYGIARDDTIQLKDYNTLHKLAAFVAQKTAAAQPQVALEDAAATQPPGPVAATTERTTHRYVVRYVSAPATPTDPAALEGKTFIVWAPGQHRADLVYAMKRAGATGLALDALPTRYEEAKSWVDQQRARSPRIHGLLFVPTTNPTGADYSIEDARVPKSLFYLVKALLTGSKSGEFEALAVATYLGGDFATHGNGPINPIEGGLVGLAKAVAREIPNATVKAIDFAAHVPPPTLAQTVLDEIGRKDGLVEVGTTGGRGTLRLLEEETAEEEPGVELQPNDVIVVSGGGTGITSDVVRRLATQAPATFVLLGRTPLHADAARYAGLSEQEWNGQRVEIQADLKDRGEKVTPVTVERALAPLRKSAEVQTTLDAVRRSGAKAEYHAVDVTDAKAVEHLVKALRATAGPVTGILHAAGLEESKLIVDKTSESFDRVYDVKILGARNLLAATQSDPLRFFLGFSSIAGRFGNAGQADYSAANDALAKLCASVRHERGATFAATAIDWSAWADKGMATRGSVMTVLKEAGVAPIPLAEGVRRCVDELAHGCRDAEVLVAGELGRLARPDAFAAKDEVLHVPTRAPAPARAPEERAVGDQVLLVREEPAAPFGNFITREPSSDGRTATATVLLDPKDGYLNDHRVDGVPYLPGVLGQEAMAELAARLAPGKHFAGSRDVEFRIPVKVLREQPLEISVVASVAHESDERVEVGCRLQSVFVNAKGERLGAPRIHFTGTMIFESAQAAAPTFEEPSGDLDGEPLGKQEIYAHFFHGPSFRVLNTVGFEAEAPTTIGVWADPRPPLFRDREASFLTSPLIRELAYQAAGSYELFKNRFLSLPKGESRLRYHRDAPSGAAVRAVARLREVRDNVAHFDVSVATTDGDLLLELEDFQLIRLRPVEATNGGPATPPGVYRARWGHDVPLPLPGVVGVRVNDAEIESAGVSAGEALTSGERADQERYRNDKRAREFFVGRLAAKEAIATLVGRPVREARGIEVRRFETGEPQARGAGMEGVLVSITHSGTTAFAAAARRSDTVTSLGIDAETIEAKASAFESEAFADEERKVLDRLEAEGRPRPELLIRFWAVKEAVLKALGKGFALDVRDVQIQRLDGDERAHVKLRPAAQAILAELGASKISVQTWTRDGLAYALAWTHS